MIPSSHIILRTVFFGMLLLTSLPTLAQEQTKSQLLVGPFTEVGGGLIVARTSIPVYALSPGCGTFENVGKTFSLGVGGYGAFPSLFSPKVGVAFRLGYATTSQQFRGNPVDPQRTYDSATSTLVTIDRAFLLDADFQSVSLDILFRYDWTKKIAFEIGPSFGYLFSSTFRQTDNVFGPGEIRFDDGQGTHDMEGGISLSGRDYRLGGTLGLSYATHLNRSLVIVPTLRLQGDLLSPANELSWSSFRATGSLALLFDLTPTSPPPLLPSEEPTPPPAPLIPDPVASIAIIGIDTDGNESDVSQISTQEVLHRRQLPLLGWLFYPEGKSVLPDRYRTDLNDKDESEEHEWSIIDAYHHLPQILVRRLKDHPESKLTLSGSASTEEASGIVEKRIESFRTLLSANGIPPERTEVRNPNSTRSDEQKREGREENRRIEIGSEDSLLTAPLIVESIERDFSPPSIRVIPDFSSPAGIQDWEMRVTQNGNLMASYSREDQEGGVSPGFQWRIEQKRGDTSIAPIVASIKITDSLGRTTVAYDTIPLILEKEIATVDDDLEIRIDHVRRSSWLLGFGYDSDQLTNGQRKELERIMEFVRPEGLVTITGFTDRTGTEEHNLELSQWRAVRVADWIRDYLTRNGIDSVEVEATGAGMDTLYFDNALPEGRVLSRSVRIQIDLDIDKEEMP
ncbi:MAG: OmpA family protein [Candidatus Kapaibacterium sp.]